MVNIRLLKGGLRGGVWDAIFKALTSMRNHSLTVYCTVEVQRLGKVELVGMTGSSLGRVLRYLPL
jgi:hypothetical protein